MTTLREQSGQRRVLLVRTNPVLRWWLPRHGADLAVALAASIMVGGYDPRLDGIHLVVAVPVVVLGIVCTASWAIAVRLLRGFRGRSLPGFPRGMPPLTVSRLEQTGRSGAVVAAAFTVGSVVAALEHVSTSGPWIWAIPITMFAGSSIRLIILGRPILQLTTNRPPASLD